LGEALGGYAIGRRLQRRLLLLVLLLRRRRRGLLVLLLLRCLQLPVDRVLCRVLVSHRSSILAIPTVELLRLRRVHGVLHAATRRGLHLLLLLVLLRWLLLVLLVLVLPCLQPAKAAASTPRSGAYSLDAPSRLS
jgi:hypothetical protein